ncbi:FHA domain-containing protein [Tumidithrix elongata RA019]|uniref:FHA domain-containing protein n=1 Tax=Tumidithrix elongata BACA0141 TaxID=2716417 RepID=A0AAW9Q441_9CYAN|nr:FHA domain-containing protein [Tumidithrix elongata RA019]
MSIARLEIRKGNGSIQHFTIASDLLSIGRTPDNMLRLDSLDVSRRHAQLTLTQQGHYVLEDLKSASGTIVNQRALVPHQPQQLNQGDCIKIGSFELLFFSSDITSPLSIEQEFTVFAQNPAIDKTIVTSGSSKPILRISTPQWMREFALTQERITFGRSPSCDICIDLPVVSSQHGYLQRCADRYEIIDLNSKNGINYNNLPIRQRILDDGDICYIGGIISLQFLAAGRSEIPKKTSPEHTQVSIGQRFPIRIGRAPQNDICIDHPSVSRFHAEVLKLSGSLILRDLSSGNGTFVNGKAINRDWVLKVGDGIRIGMSSLTLNIDETLDRVDETGNLRIDAVQLTKVVGKGIKLLDNISISILPREFVIIAGVSGGGKSTLLDALNGFRPANKGHVFVNGTDLYKNFSAYRTQLGYVPQKDIVHMELSVEQVLDYAAQLRLPKDTTPSERAQRVNVVLEELELTHRRQIPVKALSGGQLKRVSIGVELITEPGLFFLDEATSGLDPGMDAEVMQLLRKLADRGRTIMLITHNIGNIYACNLVVFLAAGGRVAYFGSPQEAPQYFGVSEFKDIYQKVERDLTPVAWQQRYLHSPYYQKYVVERQQELHEDITGTRVRQQPTLAGSGKHISNWSQFLILSRRNIDVLLRDRVSLLLMLAIAPIIGLLDFITWKPEIYDLDKGNASQVITMLFTTVLFAVMTGSLTTMREIVKEIEIYRREHMVFLTILPYIFSKVWIFALLALYQAAVFVLLKYLAIQLPNNGIILLEMYVTLVLSAIAGMMMGFLVSTVSPNQNVAPLLTIIFLIPQIIFGGGVLPVSTFGAAGQVANQLSLTKWPFEALVTITGLGRNVAMDSCWQLPEAERKSLSVEQKKKDCSCLGQQMFTRCEFPGIKAKYRPAVDLPEPSKPKAPGDPPSDPRELENYKEKTKVYQDEVQRWQKDYGKWKTDYEGALGEAEGTIQGYYRDFGHMFNINLFQHWLMLGIAIVGMFVTVVVVQKLKDFRL